MAGKSPEAFRTISEVADWLDRPAHVLRFWESKFPQIKPVKRAGGRRYYRPEDMLLLGGIKKLLHDDGMTIKGAQKLLRDQGVRYVSGLSQPLDEDTAALVVDAPEQAPAMVETVETGAVYGADQQDDAPDLFDARPVTPSVAPVADAPAPAAKPAPLGAELPPHPVLVHIAPERGILGLIAARRHPLRAADRAALMPVMAQLDDLVTRLSDARKG